MTSGPSSWSPSSTPTRSTSPRCSARWPRWASSCVLNRSGVYRVTPYVITGVRAVGLRACGRLARDARRRVAGRVHPDAQAAGLPRAGRCRPKRSSPPKPVTAASSSATGPSDARAARARRHPRSTRIAGRPAAAQRRAALELPGAADLRAGECRRRDRRRGARRTRHADGRHRLRPRPSASRWDSCSRRGSR